jgi:transposase
MDKKTIARFWSLVDKSGPTQPHCPELGQCWLWTAAKSSAGYGSFGVPGEGQKYAHRLSLALAQETKPALQVLHRCDNPACVRPSHLFQGTAADNMQDMLRKGRNANARLSAEEIIAIREASNHGETHRAIARRFRVAPPHVAKIVRGDSWAHLAGPTTRKNRTAKLNPEKVREIRSAIARGELYKEIAKRFGVSTPTIANVARGYIWKHVI